MWLNIQGHDVVVEQFRRTLASRRLASTYLFVGPEGVGKRTFALRLAQCLLCTKNDPAELSPCGECESCRLAVAGNHPDLDVVSLLPGKRRLAIHQFVGERDSRNQEGLCHSISLRPMMGRRRVAVIDDADWFTIESANCLLKTLEEPPPGALLILIGTSRSRQLPTTLSRAQVVRFKPLPADVVRDLLLAEGLVGDLAAAAELAGRSGGSLTRAREVSDAALFEMRDLVAREWNAGDFDPARLIRALEHFINEAGKEADARRQRFRQVLSLVVEMLNDQLRADSDAGASWEITLAALDRCLEAEDQLDRNANQSTLLESWIDDLASLRQSASQGVDP